MSARRAAAWAGLGLAVVAAPAHAQSAPVSVDPMIAGQGTALLLAIDESRLTSGGQAADSVTFALPRGMRVDTASRATLCKRAQAARSACPEASRIGFGRYVVAVRGYLFGHGEAELAWSLVAYLGEPAASGDAASVVLTGNLLGAGNVAALLAPALGATVPNTASAVGRLVPRRSGAYGLELRFPQLPVHLNVPAPVSAAPAQLQLALSAVRRVRQDFMRRIRVRKPSGYEVRKIRDHRLVGHHLLRTPTACRSTWLAELRVGFPSGEQRSRTRMPCSTPDG